MASTKLHFKDADWVLYFPETGNHGRPFPKYGVAYRDRRTGETQPGTRIDLVDVLEMPVIRDHYPHQVAVFKESTGKGKSWRPAYLMERTVPNEEWFINWLAELGM